MNYSEGYSDDEFIPYKKSLSFHSDSDEVSSIKSNQNEEVFNNVTSSDSPKIVSSSFSVSQKQKFNFATTVKTSKKKNITNNRVWDKKDHCVFCEKDVTNFTRHLLRKHKHETEVTKYESLPKRNLRLLR